MTLKKTLLYIIITNCFILCQAQKETAHWFFGSNSGLNFTTGSPQIDTKGMVNTIEGCASMSDKDGNLLFYTDGVTVFNKNHQMMKNGDQLMGNFSSTQSAIIIPNPDNKNIYYIFTVDANDPKPQLIRGLHYSTVNMLLDNGLGGIVENQKNIPLPLNNIQKSSQKLTAVKHSNGKDFWVITHFIDSFYSFLVTSKGVNPNPVISKVGVYVPYKFKSGYLYQVNGVGNIKASPDGKKLAIAHYKIIKNTYTTDIYKRSGFLGLYDYNNSTGKVSNEIDLCPEDSITTKEFYGIEFSPDSKKLYAEYDSFSPENYAWQGGKLFQFNLDSKDIISSKKNLYSFETPRDGIATADLQLALDGKIYYSQRNLKSLSVINNPNAIGNDANFKIHSVNLGGTITGYGLPSFVSSFFNTEILINNSPEISSLCIFNNAEFSLCTNMRHYTVSWDFGDGSPIIKKNIVDYTYNKPSKFKVKAIVFYNGQKYVFTKDLTIIPQPTINIPPKQESCDSLTLDVGELPEGYKINWEDAKGNILSKNRSYTFKQSGKYIIRLENNNGCSNQENLDITIHNSPKIEISDVYICPESKEEASLDAGIFPDYYQIQWFDSNNNFLKEGRLLKTNSIGKYKVRVTNKQTGCFSEAFASIKEYEKTDILDVKVDNNSAYIEAINAQPLQYSLDNTHWQTNPTFYNLDYGIYTAYVKNANGCITTQTFSVFGDDNVITPNGDGINDYFELKGLEKYPGSTVEIFDRNGKIVFNKIFKQNPIWNGKYLGRTLPSNTYWYIIKLTNGETLHGWLVIKNYNQL